MAALITVLGGGQALAGPDERVLERQGRIARQATARQATAGQADEQGKAAEPSQGSPAQYPRRYLRPEPPVHTGPRLDSDQFAPVPAPTAPNNSSRLVLAITLGIVALLLALGAATTWRIHRRRPRPAPTT
jgi:hypothetical protein